MFITIKVGSVISLPFGDSANIASDNSAILIAAHSGGGLTITATQVGTAKVTYRFFPDLSGTLTVKVEA